MMSKKKKISQESNSTFGLILLFLSLCCDGVCGMQQDIVVPRFKPSSLRLQQMLNIYGIIVSIITAIIQGHLLPGISFLLHNKICLWVLLDVGLFVISSTLSSSACVRPSDKCSFCILFVISLHLCCPRLQQQESFLVSWSLFYLWEMRLIHIR